MASSGTATPGGRAARTYPWSGRIGAPEASAIRDRSGRPRTAGPIPSGREALFNVCELHRIQEGREYSCQDVSLSAS
jgi:hypothetical protein